jgi:hypothetical protein
VRLYSMSARFMSVRDDYYAVLERLSGNGLDVTDPRLRNAISRTSSSWDVWS